MFLLLSAISIAEEVRPVQCAKDFLLRFLLDLFGKKVLFHKYPQQCTQHTLFQFSQCASPRLTICFIPSCFAHITAFSLYRLWWEKNPPHLVGIEKAQNIREFQKKKKFYIFKVKLAPSPQRAALILIHQWKSKLLFFCPFNVVILLVSNRVFVVRFWHILQIEKIFQKVLYFGPSRCLPSEGVLQRYTSPPPSPGPWKLHTHSSDTFFWTGAGRTVRCDHLPHKGYKAKKPARAEAKVLSEKCCLQCWIATNKATMVQIG